MNCNIMHYTTNGFGRSCNSGYAPNDPRSAEPTAQNAFIGMTSPAVVADGSNIPLSTIFNSSGNHIAGVTPITLRAGHKYLVEFTAIGKSAAPADAFGVKLQLNGVDVAGSAAAISSTAVASSVSGGAIVSVISANSSMTLVGISATNATFNYVSVRIVEVE